MKYIGLVLTHVLVMAPYWSPIAVGLWGLYHGEILGLIPLGLGFWLIFRT
jgi:hypothetical protein